MSLSQEQVPLTAEKTLSEFLTRRFIDVANELVKPSKFPQRKEMPYKPQTGDIHYFGDPTTHNYDAVISTEGFWGMTVDGWEKLNSESTGITGLGVWRYRTETGTPPASGQIRFDNVDVSSATEFYLNETNNGSTDVSAFLELLLQDGSLLYIQDQSNADNRILIEISSSVDNGTYRTYGIESIIEEGTEPSQNQTVILVAAGTAPASSVPDPTGDKIQLPKDVQQNVGGANGNVTYISWDATSIIKDAGFTHEDVTNPERIQVDATGRYSIYWNVSAIQGGAARTTLMSHIRINGSSSILRGRQRNYSRGAIYGDLSIGYYTEEELSDGDYIECGVTVDQTDASYTINTINAECEVIVTRL